MRSIGSNVRIEIEGLPPYISDFDGDTLDKLIIEDDVTIGDNVTIKTKNLHIGYGSTIESNTKISCESFEMGDNSFIGHDSKIIAKHFKCGDYVELHNHLFCNGDSTIEIGSNVWIGQNCILNARAPLKIGNGVGIGTYSCIWTHGMHGELLEGCTLYKVEPTIIEDDVWIVGSFNVIAGGLTIGEKAIILSGSQVTKNIPPRHVWAGIPATDITSKMKQPPYKNVSLDEKYEMMKNWTVEFIMLHPEYRNKITFITELTSENLTSNPQAEIIVTKHSTVPSWIVFNSNKTVFELDTKKYTKKLTQIEIDYIKFLLYEKARFLPKGYDYEE